MSRRIVAFLVAGLALVAAAGCGKDNPGTRIGNELPVIELSFSPAEGNIEYYSRRINWFAYDPDGQVTGYLYVVDPVPGDTTWIETSASEVNLFFRSPNPDVAATGATGLQISTGYHTFVVKARDNQGGLSPPEILSFTSRTVAPSTLIIQPLASQSVATTTPSLEILWRGTDLDGVISQRPIKFKYKLTTGADINPSNPNSVPAALVQQYFAADAHNFFASWDSVPGDSASKSFEGLTAGTIYYFAVVAFDEAGAYEPRFIVGANVLRFRPSLDRLGPEITVFNEFFLRSQDFGGIDPTRFVRLEIPADAAITFNWFAVSPTPGPVITGYRWALDIADISDNTVREDDNDLSHWSAWSLTETSATLPAFEGSTDSLITHNFYVEARDNIGFISLFPIQLTIIKPTFENPLLIVDDMQGTSSQPGLTYIGAYPMEAEADSFYFAVGGYPDSIGIQWDNNPGAISTPGMFSDFAFDTLDYYNAYPNEGILLSDLSRYRVVVWYTNAKSASQTDSKFGSSTPACGLRFINSVNQLNTLAVYLRQRGKVWLFGDGTTSAIANGYVTRFGRNGAKTPYTSGDNPQEDILQLGNFLYDFCHLRSEVNSAGTQSTVSTSRQYMHAAIPYLPEYKCETPPPNGTLGRTCDPRIGPTAARTAELWGDLPFLGLRGYRGTEATPPNDRRYYPTFVITQPNFITEGSGAAAVSVLDTLYLCGAHTYDANRTRVPPSDGFPNAVFYHGIDHGEVVWFGFPMHFFEHDAARQVTRRVLMNFGVEPSAPGARRGASAFRSSSGVRVIADGGTYDPRRTTQR